MKAFLSSLVILAIITAAAAVTLNYTRISSSDAYADRNVRL